MNQRLRKALEELVELSLALDLHRVTEVGAIGKCISLNEIAGNSFG